MLERVRLPEGQDAWLFTRGTLRNLDALVEGFRAKPPDPRYATIGVVIGEDVLAAGTEARCRRRRASPPSSARPARRCARSSSRWTSWSSTAIESEDPPGLPRPRRAPAGGPRRHRAAAGRQARGGPAPAGRRPADGRRHLGGRPPGPRPRHRVAGHARAGQGRRLAVRPRDRLSRARPVRAAHPRGEVRPRAPLELPLGAADDEDAPARLGRRRPRPGGPLPRPRRRAPGRPATSWGRSWPTSSSSSWTGSAGWPWRRSHRRPTAPGTITIAAPWAASTW